MVRERKTSSLARIGIWKIRKAVRQADVVVVCLSCKFGEKGIHQKNVRIALDEASFQPEGTIFIIPARLEECDYLESLKKWHWVDLFEENGYQLLMRALQARASGIDATLQSENGKSHPEISSSQIDEKLSSGKELVEQKKDDASEAQDTPQKNSVTKSQKLALY